MPCRDQPAGRAAPQREPAVDLAAALRHPLFLVALATWFLNDHVGKHHFGGVLTGKLSDVASLVCFPLLAATVHDVLVGGASPIEKTGRATLRIVAWWALATGAVMAAINVSDGAAWLYCHGLGLAQWVLRAGEALLLGNDLPSPQPVRLTMDPTDLLTLPAALLAIAIARWTSRPAR